MKIKLLKSISLILCFALIFNIAVIPASAAIDEENILYDNNYCIFANDLILNDYSARIDGSVYAGDNLQFTGNKNCIINGTLNCSNTDGENIAADNTVSDTESMADYTDQLNNEIFYKTIYDTDNFISSTEYDLTASMFVNGNLFLDQVILKNKGYIRAADSIKFNAVNDSINDYSVFMYAENGDIYVQGTNLVINGILYAPNGKIELNAKKLTVNGMIIADKIEFNGSELSVNKINSNDYPSFRPNIEIKISGEQKENRKISFDISESEDFDRIINDRTEWSITSEDGSSDNIFIDSDSSSTSVKNAVIKQAGNYTAKVTVFTDKKSYTYEQKFTIAEDIMPTANIYSEDIFYRTTDTNEAVITAEDISYSSDFDDIGSRIWSIAFDSDNDGDFDDEEDNIVSSANDREFVYNTSHVGKYRIRLIASEYFDNTIEKFISAEDYLTSEIEEVVTVDNKAPSTDLKLTKAKNLDLVFTVGSADTEKINLYGQKIEEIKTELENKGYTVTVSTVEASSISAQDSFAWTEYDHINYADRYVPNMEKHILYEDNNIVMKGYGWAPLKDFLFIEDNDPSQKIFTFDIQRDNNNWHTMEGGGFLFNSSIDNGYLRGYCILLTQQGLKLIRLNGLNVDNLRNGTPALLQNGGKVLTAGNIGNVLDNHSLKIIVDAKSISVLDNDNVIIDNYILNDEITGYGYGPITSHISHGCSQQSYFTFGNIKMETIKGDSLSKILNDHKWTSKDNRYVINLSDKSVQDMRNDELLGETGKSLIEKDITFIGLGTDENHEQYNTLLQSVDGICFDNSNADNAAEQIEGFILSDVQKCDLSIGEYITTEDKLYYDDNYSDEENDPKSDITYLYNYDYTLFESGNPSADKAFETKEPVTSFTNTGIYSISVKAKDDPTGEEPFEEYQKWSDTDTYEKAIKVHNIPTAFMSAEVYLNNSNAEEAIVKVSEDSFDNDHLTGNNKGITDKKYSWKKLSDTGWTEGMIPETVTVGEVYFLKLLVCDKENEWSRPCVCSISVDKANPDFVDNEKPEIKLSLSELQVYYGDRLVLNAVVSDNVCVASAAVYVDGELISNSQGSFVINSGEQGEHTVKVTAEDIFGNRSEAEEKYYVIDNRDKTAPQIVVTSPNKDTKVESTMKIVGSVYDENELDYYMVEYALNGSEYTTAAYSTEPVINGVLAAFRIDAKKGNVYNIKITAADKTGNTTYKTMSFTISEDAPPSPEEETIPPTIVLSSDKNRIEIGESAVVSIRVSDDKPDTAVKVFKNGQVIMEAPGTITFSEAEEGIVTFRVIAEDSDGNVAVKELSITVYDNSDKELPAVTITAPDNNSVLSGTAVFEGSVKDNNQIARYYLMIKGSDEDDFAVFAESSSGRNDDILGELDTTAFDNGSYTIRLLALDLSGNEAYTDIAVEISNEKEIVPDYERPYVKLRCNVNDDAFVALNTDIQLIPDVTDNQKVKEIKVTVNGKDISSENGIYRFETDKTGVYQIIATATDESGNEGWCQYTVRSVDTAKDSKVECEITSPSAGVVDIDEQDNIEDNRAVIKDITEIKGTASSNELTSYELSYASVNSTNYIKFAEGKRSVKNGVLGKFDPTTIENGNYNIRLRVYTESAKYSEYIIPVQVKGKNKIGNYSFLFADITLPVYTLPFSVSRTYSSMSRSSSGDFGYGWKMDLSSIKIELSHPFSSGWNVVSSGGSMPVYSLKDTSSHTVTITYPDNTTETFYLSLYPKVSSFSTIRYIDSYTLIADAQTESKLEIVDKYNNLMFDGGHNLIDFNAKKFEPKNFKLTTKQGIVYLLNVDTGVKSITDKQGNVVTFSKDGITHSDGKTIVFERDDNNRITRITDPEGRSVSYQYDSYGDLTAVTDRNNSTVRFIYGHEHDLKDIIDPNGTKAVKNEYDDSGRLISSTDANGSSIKYRYDTAKRYETVIDEFGDQTVYGYDDKGNIVSVTDSKRNVITFEYDEKGNKIKETDKQGNSVTYTYDDNGNITSITDAQGNSRRMTYTGTNQLKELLNDSGKLLEYTYDKHDFITSVTDELGNVQSFEYDGRGALTKLSDSLGTLQSIEYDESGNISSTETASGSIEKYGYDESGRCISKTIISTDGSSKTEFYTFDGNGNLIGVKDNLGNYSYGVYDACGQLISATDRMGNTTVYEYDLLGNTTKITYPDGSSEKFTYDKVGNLLTSEDRGGNKTTYTYDKFGNVITEKAANGAVTRYEYDLSGHVTKVTYPNGSAETYEYDTLYRNTAVTDALNNRTEYTYDKDSNVTSMTDPKGNVYKFEYDLAGNCTKVIYPDNTTTSSEYDVRNRLTASVDQIGARTEYTYDNANNLTSVKDALGNKTTYTYSSNGELLNVTDANGNKTNYQYDAQGRLIKTTLPGGESTSVTYDKEGRVVSSTDAKGTVSKYVYDRAGNVTQQSVGNEVTSFTYTDNGLIETVKRGSDITQYSYNNLNQIIKKVLQDGTKIEYTYDTSGNLTKVSSNYTSTSYAYDKLNRIVRVVDHNGKATLYEYDENGNRSAVKYANGVVATYTYDSMNRLVKEKIVDKNGNNIAVYEYTLDKKGNRIKAVEDGGTTEYAYDKLNRLTKETTDRAVTSYTYDKVGNRLTKTVDDVKTEYTYNSNNQLTKEVSPNSTTVYTYDKNGSLLKQTNGTNTNLYTYDDYNRLISAKVTKDGKTTTDTYTYDVEGNRLTKTTNGTLTKYIVDSNGLSQVLAELDSNNKVVAEYTHGIEIVSQIRNKITHYYLFDGNGNVRMLTDSEGAVSDTYDYDAFGTATAEAGLTINPYRYCGEYQDETTGLYYLRARYYDSTTGRFISADSYSGSTADPVSLHKYLYANANPVMNSDPTGYFSMYGMTVAIQVENTLRDTYNSALTGGFMSFMDALAGEETDPYNLLKAFGNGAMEGLKSSAITASLTAVRNLGCLAPRLAMLSSLALVGLSGKSTFEALQGAVDSLLAGNYKQALFRALGFGLSAYGTYKASTAAFDTMTGVINGTKCFVAGTLVLTEDGEKPIEDIEVGDYVYASDPETGESDYKEVLNVFIRQSNIIIHVFVNGEEIETTPTHPFWVESEWVPADKLKAGDVLTLADGTTCAIDRVYAEFTNKAITVYNFEVADFHSYYVTDTGVLVHNASSQLYSPGIQTLLKGSEWEEYFSNKFGRENVEWTTGVPNYGTYGRKTSGVLSTSVGDYELISGVSGASKNYPNGSIPGRNAIIRTHVEAHAIATMRDLRINSGILYINREPCGPATGFRSGCEYMIPRMLPEGASLRIIGPNGYDKIFFGLGN